MTETNPETLRILLRCDALTGRLFWLSRDVMFFTDSRYSAERSRNIWNGHYAGKEAFTALRNGYLSGKIFNRTYYAHRVIWAMETGAWPKGEIDHINGVRTDSRMANLRDVSRVENARNQKMRNTNTSGIMGVFRDKEHDKWRASIWDHGKSRYLGIFTCKEDAISARADAEIKYGYHENHGRVSGV